MDQKRLDEIYALLRPGGAYDDMLADYKRLRSIEAAALALATSLDDPDADWRGGDIALALDTLLKLLHPEPQPGIRGQAQAALGQGRRDGSGEETE